MKRLFAIVAFSALIVPLRSQQAQAMEYVLDGDGIREIALYPAPGYRSYVEPKCVVQSLEELERRVGQLPPGTKLHWVPYKRDPSGKPVLFSDGQYDQFAKFCRDHNVELLGFFSQSIVTTSVGNRGASEDVSVYSKISFQVMNQSGAFIPHAHITIVDLNRGSINQTEADHSGRMWFMCPQGRQLKITITAPGFRSYAETFKVESDVAKHVTLKIGDVGSGYPILADEQMQPEHVPLSVEIPQPPLELLPVPSRRFRRGRWRGL